MPFEVIETMPSEVIETIPFEWDVLEGPMVIVSSSVPMHPTPLNEIPFRELADQWARETSGFPRIKDRIAHPAYRKIINWGHDVIPYIMGELKKDTPDHWFEALSEITHNDPVPPGDRGDVRKMADAWIEWGRRRAWTS